MKTAISIPDVVFEQAEKAAKRMAVSRSKLFTRAVQSYLEVHDQSNVTERLNQVYNEEIASLDPAMAALQAATIRGGRLRTASRRRSSW